MSLGLFKKEDGFIMVTPRNECFFIGVLVLPKYEDIFSVITYISIVMVSSGITNFRNPSH